MDDKTERLWLDMLQGMQQRACFVHNDNDADGRNRNWYARQVYGDQYDDFRAEYQRLKMEDISEDDRKP